MSWWAFDEIQDSVERTKDLLLPFKFGTWARLAILVIFTGASFNMPTSFPTNDFGEGSYGEDYDAGFSTAELNQNPELQRTLTDPFSSAGPTAAFSAADDGLVIAAGALVFLLILSLLLISSVLQFVYYQSLINDVVRIRSNFKKHLKNGFNYMIFNLILIGLFLLVLGAGIFALLTTNVIVGLLGLLAFVLLMIPVAIFMGLVNNFILPETILSGQSFWTSLKTGLGKAREEWKQVGVYILTRFGIKMFLGILGLIWAFATLLVLLIPFGLIGAIAYVIEPVLLAIPAVLGVLTWFIALLAGSIVTKTYLNYYALEMFENL